MRIFKKKPAVTYLIAGLFLLLMVLLFSFRTQILQMGGNLLIHENELQPAQAIFVLGGDSYDRGNAARKLFLNGMASSIVFLGENVPNIFKAIGIDYSESEVTRMYLKENKDGNGKSSVPEITIPDSAIVVLNKGTSTKEEIEAIFEYCENNHLKSIILLSSRFHTRRISMMVKKLLGDRQLQVIIAGAPSSIYNEDEWWKTEEGLIMVNNEYVKLLYYFIKY